jgi:hypothetical protein
MKNITDHYLDILVFVHSANQVGVVVYCFPCHLKELHLGKVFKCAFMLSGCMENKNLG